MNFPRTPDPEPGATMFSFALKIHPHGQDPKLYALSLSFGPDGSVEGFIEKASKVLALNLRHHFGFPAEGGAE